MKSEDIVRKKEQPWRSLSRVTFFCFDHDQVSRLADGFAVVVAVTLPWSTSATQIFGVAWLLTVVPTLKLASVKRELMTAAGGLPVLLWCLGVIGVLWAHVSWAERMAGLNSFHRFLLIPLLLAQFRASPHGLWVIYGFLVSATVALATSFVLISMHSAGWLGNGIGVAVRDDIFQSSLFVICAFGLLGCAWNEGAKRHWIASLSLAAMGGLFLANFAFVQLFSRITLAVIPILAGLLGWRRLRWRGLFGAGGVVVIVGIGLWLVSTSFHTQLRNSIIEIRDYHTMNQATPIGTHAAFLAESMAIIGDAPISGHGTGSISDEFRQITANRSGAAGVQTDNPHNQTFAIAIQIGITGAIMLWAMWIAHLRLFRGAEIPAWLGTVLVMENIVSSTVHSHLFDFANGWLYIFGVGVLGGMRLRREENAAAASSAVR